MQNEIAQLNALRKYSLYSMPEIVLFHNSNEDYGKDLIVMNYLKGENAGNIFYLTSAKRNKLANNIVDNLIALHKIHNPDGFGEIDSQNFYKTFNEYYKEKVRTILSMATQLHKDNQLSDYVYNVAKDAAKNFDKIFYLPITESSLVHGDYNTWNILADKKSGNVTAIIDHS